MTNTPFSNHGAYRESSWLDLLPGVVVVLVLALALYLLLPRHADPASVPGIVASYAGGVFLVTGLTVAISHPVRTVAWFAVCFLAHVAAFAARPAWTDAWWRTQTEVAALIVALTLLLAFAGVALLLARPVSRFGQRDAVDRADQPRTARSVTRGGPK